MSARVFSESHHSSVTANTAGEALRVQVSRDGAEFVLRVYGEADIATSALLGQALVSASNDNQASVVLDLSGLQFIDAHCLGVMNNAHCLLREQHRQLVLRSPPPMVRRLLAICEMEGLIEA